MVKKIKIEASMDSKANKKLERIFCIIIGIIFIVLLFKAIDNYVYIPATMIMASLGLFSIGYYNRRDEEMRTIIYILFIVGVLLLMGAIIYTSIRAR